MFANSFTIKTHPQELLDFMDEVSQKNIAIFNSAVFHSGFLIGSDYYDYKLVKDNTPENKMLFEWRDAFFKLCSEFKIKPADACVQFAISPPGVWSIALNTSNAGRIAENIQSAETVIPKAFWEKMRDLHLIRSDYPYLTDTDENIA